MRRNILLIIAVVMNVVASYAAYVTAVGAERADIYFLYLHVPAITVCYFAFSLSLIASIAFLTKRKHAYDRTAEISAILGLVYGAVALIAGAVWAKSAWGAYWTWNPKQTITLILWIAYMGYVSIKLSIGNVEKRALVGAVYNILAFFLIPLNYLSATLWWTPHTTLSEFSMTPPITAALLLTLIAATLFFVYLMIAASDVRSLEDRVNILIYKRGGI
uniref:Cytochrome c biogenesis protein CcsA n=1 Tax=Candidatus Methanophagaceae archaeon ANME-1 ERB6 TaxID=2759912 RepID=A0A7G9Z1F6_9EURY|nr:cytochrome c biogenesis protein CcsA [Methanosarcinales archaeon ANME-1 ERB6]